MHTFPKVRLSLWIILIITTDLILPLSCAYTNHQADTDTTIHITIPKNYKISIIFITENGNYTWSLITQNGKTYQTFNDINNANITIICNSFLARRIINSSHPIADINNALYKGQIIRINPGNDVEKHFAKYLNIYKLIIINQILPYS